MKSFISFVSIIGIETQATITIIIAHKYSLAECGF